VTGDAAVAAEPRRAPAVRALLLAWSVVVEILDHVLGEPFRDGRLRARGWPLGLRPVVLIAVVGYGLALAGIVLSGWLRESLDLSVTVGSETLSFPRPVLWIVVFLVVLAMALLQTAALHVAWWLAAVVTVLTVLVLLFLGSFDTDSMWSPGRVTTLLVSLGIIAFTVIRRRHRFAWWEFAVILAALGVAFSVATGRAAIESAPTGVDLGPMTVSLIMSTLGQFAVPAAIAAGAAVAEVSTSTAVWSVGVVRRRLPTAAIVVGLAVVVVWRAWALVGEFTSPERPGLVPLVSSLLLVVVIGLLWYAIARVRGGRRSVPSAIGLADRTKSAAVPIAAGLSITLAPLVTVLLVTQIVFTYGVPFAAVAGGQVAVRLLTTSTAIALVRLLVGLTLLVLSIVLARRGARTIPELVGGIGVTTTTVAVVGLFGLGDWLWTSGGLTAVATVGSFGLLGWFAIRRTLTVPRMTGLTIALLLAAFFEERDFISDPLGAVLGFTGVAFVLFGFVWSFLTGGGSANSNSRRFPRPSRVLLFLANSVFGVTVLAFTALARNPDAAINLGMFAGLGDQLFGTALLVGALLSVVASVLTNRMPDLESSPSATPGEAEAAERPLSASEAGSGETFRSNPRDR